MKKLVVFFAFYLFSTGLMAQELPPKAEIRNVTDEYFGQKVVDPYRWMENLESDETKNWIRSQADYADKYLATLPLRNQLLKEYGALNSSAVTVEQIEQVGNLYFYFRREPNENKLSVYFRKGLNGIEKRLLDPDKISNDGQNRSIEDFTPSQDGKYLAYISSINETEDSVLRVIETQTGKDMGVLIDRTRGAAVSWLPDGKSFVYQRQNKPAPDSSPTEKYQKSKVYLHLLGNNPNNDRAIFGYGLNPNIKLEESQIPTAVIPLGSKYVVVELFWGSTLYTEVYVTTIAELFKKSPFVNWKKVAGVEDQLGMFISVNGDNIYLTTAKNSPRQKIISVDLRNPDIKKAKDVFVSSEEISKYTFAARDALYVETSDAGLRKIYRVDYRTNKAVPINLPYTGSATLNSYFGKNNSEKTDGVHFSLVSWTKPESYFYYDPKSGKSVNTNLMPFIDVDMSDVETVYAKAKSHDGVMIPMVILHKKGLKKDGSNPTILNGYGAYGNENISPYFAQGIKPLINLGAIYVFTGVRGGGEYGNEWYLAGKGATKPNTWKDFFACAEYLIREKYTSSNHLGAIGGSAGGVLISNAITERPELFKAVVNMVGLNNPLRSETTPTGVPNIAEFGSFKTLEGFNALLVMDGYNKVKQGVNYPAVLLTHGFNDSRVLAWMSAKMAARLQAATVSKNPVLLRIDYEAGHGFDTPQDQRNLLYADVYAFLFEQLTPAKNN